MLSVPKHWAVCTRVRGRRTRGAGHGNHEDESKPCKKVGVGFTHVTWSYELKKGFGMKRRSE